MSFSKITIPTVGERITTREGKLNVPDHPILLWIEGDGIGQDIMTASKRIWDASVQAVYGGQRKISWMEDLRGGEGGRPVRRRLLPGREPERYP